MIMGHHAGAKIAYGYDLGDDDSGWNIREVDEHGSIGLDWHDEDDDFASSLERRMKAVGVTGVKMDLYGYEWSAVFLAGPVVAEHSECGSVAFDASLMGETGVYWDGYLRDVCTVLGITPTGPCGWHLLVKYG